MTRDELNHFIKRVEKDIHMSDGLRFQPGLSVSAELLRIKYWFENIRDNGITDPTRYTVQVIPDDATGYLSRNVDGDLYFGEKTENMSNYPFFTKDEINQLKRNYTIAIDWDKAIIEQVEDK